MRTTGIWTGILTLIWTLGCNAPTDPPTSDAAKETPVASRAQLLVELPDYCNTPDAMELLPDGSILLSVPNFTDMSSPGVLMRISPENRVSRFYDLPPHPDTGKIFPMGIRVGPGGDLFLADCQALVEPKGKSRLLRVVLEDGHPKETITVATGFNVANGVAVHDGYVYVSESIIDDSTQPVTSGILRFKPDEENVQLKQPCTEDPHFVALVETDSENLKVGADGIAFDSRGNLYVGDCGDATVDKIEFDDAGNVVSNSVFAQADFMKSVDGLYYDPQTDKLYVADILANAVHAVSMDGSVEMLAQNGDTDGADGSLDGPSEAIVRGREVIVSNFDRVFPGGVNTAPDKPYTLSVIPLD